jgi:tetratricopeptide (TPR) repeat protein
MENQTSPQSPAGTLEPGIANLLAAISGELDREVQNGLPGDQAEALTGMLGEARQALEAGDYAVAEGFLASMKERKPDMAPLQGALVYTIIAQQQWERAQEQEARLIQMAENPEQAADFEGMIASQLSALGHNARAAEKLEALKDKHPEREADFVPLLSAVYVGLGRHEEAWSIIEKAMPEEGEESIGQLPLIVSAINRVIDLKKWDVWSKIQLRVRRYLKSLTKENDLLRARVVLLLECQAYMEAGRFREAEMYAELAYGMDSQNEEVRELRKQMQEMHGLSKELEKMRKDTGIHPGIAIRNMEWYYAEFNEEAAASLRGMLPEEMVARIDAEPEKLLHGILQLRFRYPAFYRRYQEEWQEVYKEKQAELAQLAGK